MEPICVASVQQNSYNLSKENKNMAFDLPELPYGRDGLVPHISEDTLNFHHGKHHNAYVTNLNKLIDGSDHENASLEEIIDAAAADPSKAGLFNNAAQVWNHTFYWHSMKPGGGGKPTGKIADLIDRDFGSYDAFATQFKAAGGGQFGSGWAWLVLKDGKLAITKTPNAETPVTEAGVTPLLTMDVWEHAYYLDYQNSRPNYMASFLDNLVNWDFANQNLADAS
jgi:Fe-Mn family superoxide dismutase